MSRDLLSFNVSVIPLQPRAQPLLLPFLPLGVGSTPVAPSISTNCKTSAMLPKSVVRVSALVMSFSFFFSISLPLPISSITLLGSALPTASIVLASHCWNGLATKKPSEVNQRVNDADTFFSVTRDDGDSCVRIVNS